MYKIIFRFEGRKHIDCCTFSEILYDGERLWFISDNPERNESYFADLETAIYMVDELTGQGYSMLGVIPEKRKVVPVAEICTSYPEES